MAGPDLGRGPGLRAAASPLPASPVFRASSSGRRGAAPGHPPAGPLDGDGRPGEPGPGCATGGDGAGRRGRHGPGAPRRVARPRGDGHRPSRPVEETGPRRGLRRHGCPGTVRHDRPRARDMAPPGAGAGLGAADPSRPRRRRAPDPAGSGEGDAPRPHGDEGRLHPGASRGCRGEAGRRGPGPPPVLPAAGFQALPRHGPGRRSHLSGRLLPPGLRPPRLRGEGGGRRSLRPGGDLGTRHPPRGRDPRGHGASSPGEMGLGPGGGEGHRPARGGREAHGAMAPGARLLRRVRPHLGHGRTGADTRGPGPPPARLVSDPGPRVLRLLRPHSPRGAERHRGDLRDGATSARSSKPRGRAGEARSSSRGPGRFGRGSWTGRGVPWRTPRCDGGLPPENPGA